jgi:hypothetical protein
LLFDVFFIFQEKNGVVLRDHHRNRDMCPGQEDAMIARVLVVLALMCACAVSSQAKEIAGVEVADQITREDGKTLQLNGAGLRSKFVFKVYLAMLYLENPSDQAEQVISDAGAKQMIMHFLYKEVGGDDLVEAWNEGFENNGSPEQIAALKDEITSFNALFDTVKSGDRIVLDYDETTGTSVIIRGQLKGVIAGKAFNDLLLSIWLGEKPVTKELRTALLGK